MIEFPLVMAMHVLADMRLTILCDKTGKYWELCKRLCGDEHAQWIVEHRFPVEVLDHKLFCDW